MASADSHSGGDEVRRQRSGSIFSNGGGHLDATAYNILAAPAWVPFAERLAKTNPERFASKTLLDKGTLLGNTEAAFRPSKWDKFPDSKMDNIELGGYTPVNKIMRSNVLFIASFHDNDAILSQFQALVVLCESFIESMTILLPFYPMGTMERVLKEGQVATASTIARMLSALPSVGRPIRVMVYDIHTLQNRFYFSGSAIASPHSAIPALLQFISNPDDDAPEGCDRKRQFDAIAFPDEGASKRFGKMFPAYTLVVCGKQRIGENRIVTIHDGDAKGKRILIVDDMVRSGGTLVKCAAALVERGAISVSAFVTHAAGTLEDIRRFLKGGDRAVFKNLIITNSVPTICRDIPEGDTIIILDLMEQFLKDL